MIRNTIATLIVSFTILLLLDHSSDIEKNRSEKDLKKAREEYFLNKLKDPATGQIPANVRKRELAFSEQLKKDVARARTMKSEAFSHEWKELGPSNVGGRTRAIAIDRRNSNVIMTAGVSGGIWKSEDGGVTWSPRLNSGSNLSIVSIAQDPLTQDTWYASMGEGSGGGSASGKGGGANYLGSGIYKSVDNGESWTLMTYDRISDNRYEASGNATLGITAFLLGPFQLTSKLLIHDQNGTSTIYLTSQYYGIWKSIDGGQSFDRFASSIINDEDPVYSEIVIDTADVMTIWFGPTSSGNNGFYRSYDLGQSFFDITPGSYSAVDDFARTVMAVAPSDPTNLYSFTYAGGLDHLLYHFELDSFDRDIGPLIISNRSNSLKNFVGDFGGELTTQGGYDMSIAVHPADKDFVVIGYTNLIRTNDAFATAIDQDKGYSWIGGYDNPLNVFGNTHHPDQHIALFDPNDPDILWAGHDGGISWTQDATAEPISWTSANNDYNVTQYYTAALGKGELINSVIGGTQDNGTPFLDIQGFQTALIPSLGDISSGDGAFCFIGDTLIYTSAQEGAILVGQGSDIGNYLGYFERSDLNTLFIHPFAIDPNEEGTLYYPDFNNGLFLRNTRFADAFAQSQNSLVDNNWETINLDQARTITALKVSDKNPSSRLYFGGLNVTTPYLGVMDSANVLDGSNINYFEYPQIASEAYLVDIVLNSKDANELLLVYSSYNITGLYHSLDGGQTITAVEGNLGVDDDLDFQGLSGPSMRAAEIVHFEDERKYVVATSIGLFSTSLLDGANTNWALETDLLDNVVIEDLDSRESDGAILVGTHGRGMFLGKVLGANTAPTAFDTVFDINENAENGTLVGLVGAEDPEGDNLTYEIINGNDNTTFTLSSEGQILVNDSSLLNFETGIQFVIAVRISDGELSTDVTFTINLIDINESPVVEDFEFSIEENSDMGTSVGTVTASDPENDILSYEITSGNIDNAFLLNSVSGELSVMNSEVLDFEETEQFVLELSVSDGELTAISQVIVDLIDLDDVLGITEPDPLSVFPNPTSGPINFNVSQEISGKVDYQLFDVSGKLCQSNSILPTSNQYEIEIQNVKEGVYYLILSTQDYQFKNKVLISR